MLIKYIKAFLTIFLVTNVAANENNWKGSNTIRDYCEELDDSNQSIEDIKELNICFGMILGIIDFHAYINKNIDAPMYCLPKKATTSKEGLKYLTRIVYEYTANNYETESNDASMWIIKSFADEFPCNQ